MSGILPERGAQGVLERIGMGADLALVDQALLVLVHELDRVLDRDDVILARPVDVVDHRAERGRLARTGRPGDENQPLVQVTELQQVLREAELLGRQNLAGDHPEDGARTLPVDERIGAKAREAGNLVGEIGVVPLREFLAVAVGHDRPEQRLDGLDGQHRTRTDRAAASGRPCG